MLSESMATSRFSASPSAPVFTSSADFRISPRTFVKIWFTAFTKRVNSVSLVNESS